jgi:hypothetical protein
MIYQPENDSSMAEDIAADVVTRFSIFLLLRQYGQIAQNDITGALGDAQASRCFTC